MNKPTMIVGASPNPSRYSYLATLKIAEYGHTVFPMGIRNGRIGSMDILIEKAPIDNVHTVTLYVGSDRQKEWEDYILEIHPKRIIFNPGAENNTLWKKAEEAGIECIDGCTLVMLSTGQF
jgi:predicted CoA-binding protein